MTAATNSPAVNPVHRNAAVNCALVSLGAYKVNAHAKANGARRAVYDSRSLGPRLTRLAKAHDFEALEALKNEVMAQVEAFMPGFEATARANMEAVADRHDTAIREAKAAGSTSQNIAGLENYTEARLHVCGLNYEERWN